MSINIISIMINSSSVTSEASQIDFKDFGSHPRHSRLDYSKNLIGSRSSSSSSSS